MRTALFVIAMVVVFGGSLSLSSIEAQSSTIPAGSSVYIEKMDAQFELEFRAELARQKVALKVVATREEAQLLIVGAEQADATFTQRSGGMVMSVRRGGTVTLLDKTNSTTLWTGTWEVRSLNPKDEKKAASNLVGKLKKAIRR